MPDFEPPESVAPENRLGSWKEIASYLGAGVRSVQRWEEAERLPVRRHAHDKRSTVYAYKTELDIWRHGRSDLVENPAPHGKCRRGGWVKTRNAPGPGPFCSAWLWGLDCCGVQARWQEVREAGGAIVNLSVALPAGQGFEFGPDTGGARYRPTESGWYSHCPTTAKAASMLAR
ncbi:MAG: hypothetical protein WKF37_00250 [Bryobacteraceae bacterium]